jgi:hypothetical protein
MRHTVSPEDRDREMDRAANRYIRGEITSAEYRRVERQYRPNYLEAAKALGECRPANAPENSEQGKARKAS